MRNTLPVHPTLTHPVTGAPIHAIYVSEKTGRVYWPVLGGDGTDQPPADPPAGDPPADNPPQPPAPPAPPADKTDISALPADVQKLISDLRGEAAKHRTDKQTATQQAQAASAQRDAVLKALGLTPEGKEDVDPVQAATAAQEAAFVAQAQLAIFQAAGRLGADAGKLLDSVSFIDSLDTQVTAQPGDPKFTEQIDAAITAALTANPAYKTGPAVPPASGNPLPPTPGEKPKRPTSLGDAIRARHQNTGT